MLDWALPAAALGAGCAPALLMMHIAQATTAAMRVEVLLLPIFFAQLGLVQFLFLQARAVCRIARSRADVAHSTASRSHTAGWVLSCVLLRRAGLFLVLLDFRIC